MTPTTTCGHVWADDGQLEDGTPTHRCERCAVRSHWPAAEFRCALYPDRAPPLMVTCPPLHADQWQPPYVPIPTRRCAICSRGYRTPVRQMATTVCSRNCARARKAMQDRRRRGQVYL